MFKKIALVAVALCTFGAEPASAVQIRKRFESWESVCTIQNKRRECHVLLWIRPHSDATFNVLTMIGRKGNVFSWTMISSANIYTSTGIGIFTGQTYHYMIKIQRCVPERNGCIAEVNGEVSLKIIADFLREKEVSYHISLTESNGLYMKIPLEGFQAAMSNAFSEFEKLVPMEKQ